MGGHERLGSAPLCGLCSHRAPAVGRDKTAKTKAVARVLSGCFQQNLGVATAFLLSFFYLPSQTVFNPLESHGVVKKKKNQLISILGKFLFFS